MAVLYGMRIENVNAIIDKAKDKKDGCYMFRGVAYRVRKGCVTHYASDGLILEACGVFNAQIGRYDGCTEAGKKMLRDIK